MELDVAALTAALPVLSVPQTSIDRALQDLGNAVAELAPKVAGLAGRGAADILAVNDGVKSVLADRDAATPEATAKFMMAGTLQPKPTIKGTKALPGSPNARIRRSMTKAARAM